MNPVLSLETSSYKLSREEYNFYHENSYLVVKRGFNS